MTLKMRKYCNILEAYIPRPGPCYQTWLTLQIMNANQPQVQAYHWSYLLIKHVQGSWKPWAALVQSSLLFSFICLTGLLALPCSSHSFNPWGTTKTLHISYENPFLAKDSLPSDSHKASRNYVHIGVQKKRMKANQ